MSEIVQNVETVIKIVLGAGDFLNYAEKRNFVGYIAVLFTCFVCCQKDKSSIFLKRELAQKARRVGETKGRTDI